LMDDGKVLYPRVDDLNLAHKLAKKYSALTDKDAVVVKSMSTQLRSKGHLTPPQVSYLKSLLEKIHSKKVSGKTKEESEALKRLYDWIA
ncbi:MAG: hypothetical protein NWS49_06380, partial [Opitutales bacterium]|nr:hypothetical protein [Opitutales bacterium]